MAEQAFEFMDDYTLCNALWCFVHALELEDEAIIEMMASPSKVAQFTKLLAEPDINVVSPALKCVATVISVSEQATDIALFEGLLDHTVSISGDDSDRQEICFVWFNVLAGTKMQVE